MAGSQPSSVGVDQAGAEGTIVGREGWLPGSRGHAHGFVIDNQITKPYSECVE
jgi:hypothetical protein